MGIEAAKNLIKTHEGAHFPGFAQTRIKCPHLLLRSTASGQRIELRIDAAKRPVQHDNHQPIAILQVDPPRAQKPSDLREGGGEGIVCGCCPLCFCAYAILAVRSEGSAVLCGRAAGSHFVFRAKSPFQFWPSLRSVQGVSIFATYCRKDAEVVGVSLAVRVARIGASTGGRSANSWNRPFAVGDGQRPPCLHPYPLGPTG